MFKKYLYKSFILKALLLLFIFSLIIGIITFVRSYTISNPNEIYGVNVEMSQLLPNSSSYVINNKGEDLIDLAAKLGVNMFRITNSTGNNVNKDATYSKAEWDVVLNKMRKKGIKALILVENPSIYQKIYPQHTYPL